MENLSHENFENCMSMPEVLRILDVSRPTLTRLIKEKKLPATKVGRNWKFQPRHVREFLDTGAVTQLAKIQNSN